MSETPTTTAALFAQATRAHQAGDLPQAEQLYRRVLASTPNHADVLYMLGIVCSQQGRYADATGWFQQAVALQPNNPALHNNLGEALRRQGNLEQAATCYRHALALAPDLTEAHYNLANVCKAQEQYDEAVTRFQHAIRLKPSYAKAHYNLGNTLMLLERYDEAAHTYERAIALQPGSVEAHYNLGNALSQQRHYDQAMARYRHCLALDPDFALAYRQLGEAHRMLNNTELARQAYQHYLTYEPDDDLLRLHTETMHPSFYISNREIDDDRARILAALERAAGHRLRFQTSDLQNTPAYPSFMLNYQGRNDRPIREAWGRLYQQYIEPAHPKMGSGKLHIGFVMDWLHDLHFANLMGGIINRLPTSRFRVTVACGSEAARQQLQPHFDPAVVSFLVLPKKLEAMVARLHEARFDLVYFWEIASHATNYFLPFFRVAPVQCTSWGVSVTSGIPTMDYYLSAATLETDSGDDYYTERLVRFSLPPVYYRRPPGPETLLSRADLGFADDQHLYVCPQNILKIHPDVDPLIAGILRRDPRGVAVFLKDGSGVLARQFQQRLQITAPDVVDRVRLIDRLSKTPYHSLMRQASVIIDPPHFTGCNTSYDALSAGTPLVTLPGQFLRSRYTCTLYHHMGVPDCVASSPDDYINLAVRFGTDPAERERVRRRILDTVPVLFEREEIVAEFADFFEAAVEQARG